MEGSSGGQQVEAAGFLIRGFLVFLSLSAGESLGGGKAHHSFLSCSNTLRLSSALNFHEWASVLQSLLSSVAFSSRAD